MENFGEHAGKDTFRFALLGTIATTLLTTTVAAQCQGEWRSSGGYPGADDVVRTSTSWDPDGPGPALPVLVVGGSFGVIEKVAADNIAMFDPATATWSSIGTGPNGTVTDVVALANGDLVACGNFAASATSPATEIARWDGTSWTAIPSLATAAWPIPGQIRSLAGLPNGDLVAGGRFDSIDGVPAADIARWDGSQWHALGAGIASGGVLAGVWAMTVLPNGDLVAAGGFQQAGTTAASNIARWNGAAWSAMGTGLDTPSTNPVVTAVAGLPSGEVVAGGTFTSSGGLSLSGVARWDGGRWSPIGAGLSRASAFGFSQNGDLLAAGSTSAAPASTVVSRWNGTSWSHLGAAFVHASQSASVATIATLPGGHVFAGGSFEEVGGVRMLHTARWNGSSWSAIGSGPDGRVESITALPDGGYAIAGYFSTIDGVACNRVARLDDTGVAPLGSGQDARRIAAAANGDVFVDSPSPGFNQPGDVMRWDGVAWSTTGLPVWGQIQALMPLANGDLIAAGNGLPGQQPIAAWGGVAWHQLGNLLNNDADALAQLPNGNLVAGGFLLSFVAGLGIDSVVQWDGVAWAPLPGISQPVHALVVMPNGDLIAGGAFTTASGQPADHIARWDGLNWHPLLGGVDDVVRALAVLPSGDLVAGGDFGIARWNGTAWSSAGLDIDGTVQSLAVRNNGELLVGGAFGTVAGEASPFLTRLVPDCPPIVTSTPSGCTTSSSELATQSLPFVGADVRTVASGLPATGVALVVHGVMATSLPLTLIHPLGAPGCNLLVAPATIDGAVPANGALQMSWTIPHDLALVGQTFYQQVVAAGRNGAGTITSVSATNRLAQTIGAF